MGSPADTRSPRLSSLARRAGGEREATLERCDMCGVPIPAEHRHLLDVRRGELVCACRACSTLFDSGAAGSGGRHLRIVPDRRLRIDDFALTDVMWEELRLPVDMAFFFHSTEKERVAACYPGPMGATESLLTLEAWRALEEANPVLLTLEPDVEALLVNRSLGARRHWLAPIDECWHLAGLIRTTWRGLTGGREVWEEIGRFFDALDRRSKAASKDEGGS